MTRFFAREADEASVASAAALLPGNPFCTPSYVSAQRALGHEAWLIGMEDDSRILAAAVCLLRRGRLRRSIVVPSLPSLPVDSPFWKGLDAFCGQEAITDVELSTFASPDCSIPTIRGETQRVERMEFAMPLQGNDLWAGLSKGHRERIKKGRKHGLQVRRGASAEAIDAHVALHVNSMDRRKRRGEAVSLEFERTGPAALLSSGAGELFQAVLDGEVLSSLLVLRSERGAYSESSGNSAAGMSVGASHFLRYETALLLQTEGVETFFLGGVRPSESGLRSYKAGFGTTVLPMTSVIAYRGSVMRRKLSSFASSLAEDPLQAVRALAGRAERYVAFVARPCEVPPPGDKPDWTTRKISDDVLLQLPDTTEELRAQKRRLAKGRINDAYGLYIGDTLAGIAWMIPFEHDRRYAVRNVKLRQGEVEITHCVTLPEFRGRGVYTHLIRSLCATACEEGVRRVYMITNRGNIASQGGIAKAGLVRTGGIHRQVLDYVGDGVSVTFRRHRWGPIGWR